MDPIANLLSSLRNAQLVGKQKITVPFSRVKFDIAKILEKEGFVEKVSTKGSKDKKCIDIVLRYIDGEHAIAGAKRISKSGQRIYKGRRTIGFIKGGYGLAIISTSQGIMTDKDAKRRKLGGEIMCAVW